MGVAEQRDDFVAAVRRGIDPFIERMDGNGYLAGRFYEDWEPAAWSSCLTGSAQIAIVCFRLYEVTGEGRYRRAAHDLIDFLKALQMLNSPNPALNGAIAGSF